MTKQTLEQFFKLSVTDGILDLDQFLRYIQDKIEKEEKTFLLRHRIENVALKSLAPIIPIKN